MTISFLVRAPMATLGAAIVGTTIALLYQPYFHFLTSDISFDYLKTFTFTAIVGLTIALLYQPHFHFSTSDISLDC